MKKKRRTKQSAELEELRRAYKRYCKFRFFVLATVYMWDYLAKVWVLSLPLLIKYMVMPDSVLWIGTPLAILGCTLDVSGKIYHSKHTKFRKHSFYEKNGVKK